jgi:hypothetical protein
MKKKILAILAGTMLALSTSFSQGINNLYVETGFDMLGCFSPEKEYIRAVNSTYWAGFYAQNVQALAGIPHFGFRYEKMISGNHLGLSAGLRYSQLIGLIGRDAFMSGSDKYFYVNYRESGSVTEYARVLELQQKTGYLGLPLELRITPGKDRFVKMYYRAGLSFNVKVHSETDISFLENSMDQYKNEVAAIIEKPSPFYASFYMGGGLKFGYADKPGIMIGFNMLTVTVTGKGTGLVRPIAGAGGQIMARIPLNHPEQ